MKDQSIMASEGFNAKRTILKGDHGFHEKVSVSAACTGGCSVRGGDFRCRFRGGAAEESADDL